MRKVGTNLLNSAGMKEMGTMRNLLKGGEEAQDEEEKGLLFIRSEFRSAH
jgi:hypothetical protein